MKSLVLVNVDMVQLMLLRASRASKLLRLHNYLDEAERLDEAAELLRDEIDANRRHENMHKFMLMMSALMLMMVVLVGAAWPSVAQDVTPEATAVPTVPVIVETGEATISVPVLIVLGLIAIAVIFVGGYVIVRVIDALEKSHPAGSMEKYIENFKSASGDMIEKTLWAARDMAKRTTTPLDDLLLEIGEPGVLALARMLRAAGDKADNAGPLPEGIGARRDLMQAPGVGFGGVKADEPGEVE